VPETVFDPGKALLNPEKFADGYIYVCTREPKGSFSDQFTYQLVRIPVAGGAPETLATSDKALSYLTKDDAFYYAFEWQMTDTTGNTWDPALRKIAVGTTTLVPFAPSFGVNEHPDFVGQTEKSIFVESWDQSPSTTTFLRYDKPGPNTASLIHVLVPGSTQGESFDGTTLQFALFGDTQVFAYTWSVGSPTPQKGAELPNRCFYFRWDPMHPGWVARCADHDGGAYVARISTAGNAEVISPFVRGIGIGLVNNAYYWTNDNYLEWVELDTKVEKALPIESISVIGIDADYVYYHQSMPGGNARIRRVALKAATPL
jgi:hypothetical protein